MHLFDMKKKYSHIEEGHRAKQRMPIPMAKKRKPLDFESIRLAVGQRIREARLAAGLSQVEVAVQCGYTAANPVSKLENGDVVHLDVARVAAIARACDVELSWIIEPAALAMQGRLRSKHR